MNKLGIVSHDAGGAEILSHWIKKNYSKNEYIFYLDGPAEKIFKNNIDNKLINEFANCEIGKFIELSDLIITGTSWQSSIERRFIKSAKLHGKKVISILDHWVNYRERFITEGNLILPDEIWVCDEYAKKIAEDKFKNISLKLIENPYIENLKKNITSYMKLNSNLMTENILYVCEPIKDHAKIQFGDENYHGYTEESALEYFLKQIDLLNIDYKNIIIRPHPSENIKKYNWVIAKFSNLNIIIDNERSLMDQIMLSNTVVGCESMAMVVGLVANKRVISSIPPSGRECSLPHKSIEHLKEIL